MLHTNWSVLQTTPSYGAIMRKAADGITYPTHSADDCLEDLRERWRGGSAEQAMDVRLHEKTIRVRISRAARAAAAQLTEPLIVEMELYFSCLVRKAVRFRPAGHAADTTGTTSIPLSDNLVLQFRPVTTRHCSLSAGETAPPLEAMPVTRPQAFVPHWLKIDFHHGAWAGEFGY